MIIVEVSLPLKFHGNASVQTMGNAVKNIMPRSMEAMYSTQRNTIRLRMVKNDNTNEYLNKVVSIRKIQ